MNFPITPETTVEQIEKRMQELKVIRFWLTQNVTMVDASINALDLSAKSIQLLAQNPVMQMIDPMKAIFNPMQMWVDNVKLMQDAFTPK